MFYDCTLLTMYTYDMNRWITLSTNTAARTYVSPNHTVYGGAERYLGLASENKHYLYLYLFYTDVHIINRMVIRV